MLAHPSTSCRSFICRIVLALLLIAAGELRAQTFIGNPNFQLFNDVAYVPGGGPIQSGVRREIMDIYKPIAATGPLPVVLLIHGGGWNSGSLDGFIDTKGFLATGDYVVAAMNYRLNTPIEPLFQQVDDVKAAIRYLKANAATFGLDGLRVALYGQSAGAHLASLAALTSDVPFFGLSSDLANQQNLGFTSNVRAVVDWAGPPVPPGSSSFYLAPYISPGDPAFKLFHSVNDSTVGISFVRQFRNDLVAGGLSASLTEITTGNHFPTTGELNAAAPEMRSFLNAQLGVVPEPGPALLLGLGALLLTGRRARRCV